MKRNAKENLRLTLEELCSCENHLSNAYLHAEESHNREEIHSALKAVGNAVNATQDALLNYKD